jgi:hypothetical protein
VCLYTFNVSDFYRLHKAWAGAGREHAGMILASQQRFSVGEQLRRKELRSCSRRGKAITSPNFRKLKARVEFIGDFEDAKKVSDVLKSLQKHEAR